MPSAAEFQTSIRFHFNDSTLLLRALTHRSYLNEVLDHPVPHNERLEFLGDAIIDFLVGEYLFNHLPDMREGDLSALRAALVRTEALARFAEQINLGPQVLMGRGEETSGGRSRPSLLADAFEALVAAMYLDQGMDAVRLWVDHWLEPAVRQLGSVKDAKSLLQELSQAELGLTPVYKVIAQEGPDHERLFTIQVLAGEEVLGMGQGRSKQVAAQAAARAALGRFGVDDG
ncbi:MAG: ribonuclease III [Ardenticatenales bacterium]|nr:ribonuclease III [Ardenticatenales bacterium]